MPIEYKLKSLLLTVLVVHSDHKEKPNHIV